MEVRDPIHGVIALTAGEMAVADHPWVQRLRHIRQTGFSQLPFPGATHSRYSHCLGVMHLAGFAFDKAYSEWSFSKPGVRERLRATVRLAALLHDLGHAPFSHCMEFCMPSAEGLPLHWYKSVPNRRATHEDYTIAILTDASLRSCIEENHPTTAQHVAALISGDVVVPDSFFSDGGLDHRRLCSQIVSSELDVDRLDYLVRDATYTGAAYGKVDTGWLLSNLGCWVADGSVNLALRRRAVYAFDHFLLARHHMFLMVYFHHKSVVCEELLRRHVEGGSGWIIPSNLDEYRLVDDVALLAFLRTCTDEYAKRVVEQRLFRRAIERQGSAREADLGREITRLEAAGIDHIYATSTGRLSRYANIGKKRARAPEIYVVEEGRRAEKLSKASQVFRRYADASVIGRLYVRPEELDEAKRVLRS